MTTQITPQTTMTDGQRKQIKRFIEDGLNAINLDDLGLSKEEAQQLIEKGDVMQVELKDLVIKLIKKLSVIDQRFGPAVAEFDLTVPTDYDHCKQIDQFGKKNKKLKTTYYYNNNLTSKNYANATNKLVPGKTYNVKIFPILKRVTSEDCMNFLKRQRAILVGGQGLTLAQDLKKEEFPVSKWTVSFDEKNALWSDSDGYHGVSSVFRGSDGGWEFDLGSFEGVSSVDDCLLCFCDK